MKKLSSSVSWENKNILSYLYQPKEHMAHRLVQRNENIYNFYSGQLTQPKQEMLKKESDIIRFEADKRNAAYDALEQSRK